MVSSSEVPSSYTLRWNARAGRANRRSSSTESASGQALRPKYCASCNRCRQSRVKCSGGTPCSRCARLPDPSSCVYSISQRRGKHKAPPRDVDDALYRAKQSSGSSSPSMVDNVSDLESMLQLTSEQQQWDNLALDPTMLSQPMVSQPMVFDEPLDLHADLLGMLDSMTPTTQPHYRAVSSSVGSAACSCAISHEACLVRLGAVQSEASAGLDKILQLFQDVSKHTPSYLRCTQCDDRCPRLMSFTMLHQRQVHLLCLIAKNPVGYLGKSEDLRFTLGVYQTSPEDDSDFKRLAIRAAALKVNSDVASWEATVRACFNDITELRETSRINVQWMLDAADNLKSRLKVILSLLDKKDWVDCGRSGQGV
ncbi:hypothetical protein GQ53DRAFT_833747 [Thozetella sp. PMI_491]|nr:hypothetical protein GQ53DRAFT_833747 [Thozetella sp. PMI_491]